MLSPFVGCENITTLAHSMPSGGGIHSITICARSKRLRRLARERYSKEVIHLALRWVLDRGERTIALWGARRPEQLEPISGVLGWRIDEDTMREIDRILEEEIPKPVGPEFMAPSKRAAA